MHAAQNNHEQCVLELLKAGELATINIAQASLSALAQRPWPSHLLRRSLPVPENTNINRSEVLRH